MSPNTFFTPLNGQSLLYPGQSSIYSGQCVQPVLLWLKATGTNPPIYPSAADYFTNGVPGYTKIPAGQPIKTGDIIVWGKNFPPSGGNGHIDVADSDGTFGSFSAWDSNWVPLILRRFLHNGNDNNYIAGYLRKEYSMPTITPEALQDFENWKTYGLRIQAGLTAAGLDPNAPDFVAMFKDLTGWKATGIADEEKIKQLKAQLAAQTVSVVINGITYVPK